MPNPYPCDIQPKNRFAGLRLSLGLSVSLGLGLGVTQAQFTWQTTHTTNGGYNQGTAMVVRNEVRATVYPDYLDVEEDLEVATQGVVSTGNDAATLEFVGNFSLSSDAAIVGGLLWDGNTILGAKLLSKSKADSLYEQQVERNSVPLPRPRDPLLLEEMSPGSYRVRIYPIALGATRHFRLRYHIPPGMSARGMYLPLRTLAYGSTAQITVHLTGAEGVTSAIVTQGTNSRQMDLPRSLILNGPTQILDNTTMPSGHGVGILFVQPGDVVGQAASLTQFSNGTIAGNYFNLSALVPAAVLGIAQSLNNTSGQNFQTAPVITATVSNASHAYDLPLTCTYSPFTCSPLVFHGKSDSPWDSTLLWTVFDKQGKVAETFKQIPKVFHRNQDTATAILWAASTLPFSEKRENPLGPVYGFVDGWASLLALEKDALNSERQANLTAQGVPRIPILSLQDVLPNYNNPTPTPNGPIITTAIREHKSQNLLSSAALTWTKTGTNQIRIQLTSRGFKPGSATVQVLTMDGKSHITQSLLIDHSGMVSLSCATLKPGHYWLRVEVGGKTWMTHLHWNGV